MSDPYDGVTAPDPERAELIRSVFRPASLKEVARAISVASEHHRDFYVERSGDRYRWSFATKGGPYPLHRITARFLRMDYHSLVGVGTRLVGEEWGVQIVDEDPESNAWTVLTFAQPLLAAEVIALIVDETSDGPTV
jgi:hypothetical protein